MRTFISVEFNKNLKEQIVELQDELRIHTHRGRWKHQDNFHLTLKFLGEINPDSVSDIINRLRDNPVGVKGFTLDIGDLGRFRGDETIRILWLGIKDETGSLSRLKNEIENEMHQLGYPKETRKYSPHITIARDIIPNESMEKLQEIYSHKAFNKIHVKSFHLMLSEYINRKRLYTSLKSFNLE